MRLLLQSSLFINIDYFRFFSVVISFLHDILLRIAVLRLDGILYLQSNRLFCRSTKYTATDICNRRGLLPGILAVLAAGGIAFGASKLYRSKKNRIAK